MWVPDSRGDDRSGDVKSRELCSSRRVESSQRTAVPKAET